MDMEHSVDEVINEISKIERAASNIEDESQREKEEYARLIDNKIKEFDERIDKETEENLANLRLKLEEEKRKELTAMRSEIVARTEKMDELYERNKEKWVDGIVQEIIKE